jgi:hypothetical protein
MVTKEQIEQLISPRVNHVLLIGQASLSESQFQAYRKLILDTFGKNGLGKDLDKIFCSQLHKARDGTGRNTLGKEGGAP